MELIVKDIIEEDFGCEGRPDGYISMCRVILSDGNGEENLILAPDEDLYRQNIEVGDRVHFDGEEIVKE